jgi:hypothetical protein
MTRTLVTSVALLVITLSIGSAATASAQSPQDDRSRAQTLAAARDEKSEDLSAPKRSMIERALYWYDTRGMRLGWRAIHFSGGSFPQGAGFGYGIGITEKAIGSAVVDPHQPNRIDGTMFAARSIRGYQRLAAQMDMKNVTGGPVDLSLRWQDYRLPQEDFYGLGDTDNSRRSNYGLTGSESGVGIAWRAVGNLAIGGEVSYLTPIISEGTDARFATTQSRFTEEEAPGMSGLPSFVRGDLSLAYDWRDSETHPRRGGHYKAIASQYRGIDDATFDFRRVDISVQQIVPLPNRYRRIELRAAAAMTDAAASSVVPFIYQPALGGMHTLRGFSESRFRDRNAVWASAEYQWEAWWALDAAFFVDAGQVAAHRSDLSLRNFDVTYGIGFRLHSNEHFIARLDLARGREGFHPILGFKYGF